MKNLLVFLTIYVQYHHLMLKIVDYLYQILVHFKLSTKTKI